MPNQSRKANALKLYYKTRSVSKTVEILGYPTENQLKLWIMRNERRRQSTERKSRPTELFNAAARERAIEHYYAHGEDAAGTSEALGYPGESLLNTWVSEDPKKWRRCSAVRKPRTVYSDEFKRAAVEQFRRRYQTGERTVEIAERLGIPQVNLYAWDKATQTPISGAKIMTGTPTDKTNYSPQNTGSGSDHSQLSELTEMRKVLDEMRSCLIETRSELIASRQELMQKQAELDQNRRELEQNRHELERNRLELEQNRREQNDDREALIQGRAELQQLRQELAQATKSTNDLFLIYKEVNAVLKKDAVTDLESLSNREKTQAISVLLDRFPRAYLLSLFGIAESTYCYQQNALVRPDPHKEHRIQIRKIFEDNYESYGPYRIWLVLKRLGVRIAEKVVRKLMKEEGLQVHCPRKKKYNSYKGEISAAPENLVNRYFHADAKNRLWVTDITEFAIPAGKVYLSPVIDCYDGFPVSWRISTSPNGMLANTMLYSAIETLEEGEHPVIHSDRGVHYRSNEWIQITTEAELTRSMSRKGCSPDNAACEGFFGRVKNEFFYNRDWHGVSIEQFIEELEKYLIWYRDSRIKASLGGLSPAEFRQAQACA